MALILLRSFSGLRCALPPNLRVTWLEAAFEKAASSPTAKKFLEDAGEQVAIRKGAALKRDEYDAMGKLAKVLNLTPQ